MTYEKDIVLIYFEDQPLCFARIEDISPDVKKHWYHVSLLLLKLPVELVTWIIKDEYIDGGEFTMSGKKMRIEKVISPWEEQSKITEPSNAEIQTDKQEKEDKASKEPKVISFPDRFSNKKK
ncbi:MAG: hypothetical protein HQK76_06970 [Desulfobacterales bacterium]|nr:hypothetical protein [Desulfobacterales bacterium]